MEQDPRLLLDVWAAPTTRERNLMADAETLVAWVREAADELEKAHAYLDDCTDVPRDRKGVQMTLVARIAYMDGLR